MNQTFNIKKDNKFLNKDDVMNNLKNNYSNNIPIKNQNISSNNSIRSSNNNIYNNPIKSNNNISQNMNYNKTQYPTNYNNTILQDDVSEYTEEDDEYEEEEVNIDPLVFSDSNPEFVHFKQNVKDWVTLDDDIKTLQDAIKKRKKRINELTPQILDFMKRFNINDLNTQNGQLRYTTSLLAKPVNKNFLLSKLGEFFKDNEKSEALTTYIYDNRIKEEKVKLKRVIEKKKINI
jgi:hypothetical protein